MSPPAGSDDDDELWDDQVWDDDGGGPWDDFASARRPHWRDLLAGAGLALAAGVLIAVVVVGGLVAFVVASLRPVHRDGPGDGRHSGHLPVEVAPATNLRDGDVVQVRASRLAGAGEAVIAQCAVEADTRARGVAECDLVRRSEARVRQGGIESSFRVTRSITLGDDRTVDCAAGFGRCVLMVASAENYDRSGFAVFSFVATGP